MTVHGLSLLAFCPSRCNQCRVLVVVGAGVFHTFKKISQCLLLLSASRLSGQRWQGAVRRSAACADRSLPPFLLVARRCTRFSSINESRFFLARMQHVCAETSSYRPDLSTSSLHT